MAIVVEAVYENGSFRPAVPVELPDGASVKLVVDLIGAESDPLDEVIGTVEDGPEFSLAERHDEVLYGKFHRKGFQP